jgi:hypothetical protein
MYTHETRNKNNYYKKLLPLPNFLLRPCTYCIPIPEDEYKGKTNEKRKTKKEEKIKSNCKKMYLSKGSHFYLSATT